MNSSINLVFVDFMMSNALTITKILIGSSFAIYFREYVASKDGGAKSDRAALLTPMLMIIISSACKIQKLIKKTGILFKFYCMITPILPFINALAGKSQMIARIVTEILCPLIKIPDCEIKLNSSTKGFKNSSTLAGL